MSLQTSRLSLAVAIATDRRAWCGPVRMLGQAQAPTTAAPQKNWKDRAEYDLFDSITKRYEREDQAGKAAAMGEAVSDHRLCRRAADAVPDHLRGIAAAAAGRGYAKQILTKDPKNFSALYYIMFYTRALAGSNPTPEVLDQGEKAAKAIVENINTPPPNVTEAQWKTARTDVENLAHTTLGWIEMQRHNWENAEAEFQKSLAINPNNGEVDYLMGTAIAIREKGGEDAAGAVLFCPRGHL